MMIDVNALFDVDDFLRVLKGSTSKLSRFFGSIVLLWDVTVSRIGGIPEVYS